MAHIVFWTNQRIPDHMICRMRCKEQAACDTCHIASLYECRHSSPMCARIGRASALWRWAGCIRPMPYCIVITIPTKFADAQQDRSCELIVAMERHGWSARSCSCQHVWVVQACRRSPCHAALPRQAEIYRCARALWPASVAKARLVDVARPCDGQVAAGLSEVEGATGSQDVSLRPLTRLSTMKP